MAEQYVVNKEELVASADAIRAKTGDTAEIAWSESTGFASAIEAISSGAKIATGSVTVGSDLQLRKYAILVQGVGFDPKRVILYRVSDRSSLSSLSPGLYFINCVESGEERSDLPGYYSCHATANICETSGEVYITTLDQIMATFLSEGRFIILQWMEGGNDAYAAAGTYNWIAIG
jgi:hypothetical protein